MKTAAKVFTGVSIAGAIIYLFEMSRPPVTGDARIDEVTHDLDDMKDKVVDYWNKNCKFPDKLPPSTTNICTGGSLCITDDGAKPKWKAVGIELRDSSYFTYETDVLITPKSHQYSLIAKADAQKGGPVHSVKLNIVGTPAGCKIQVIKPFHRHKNE